MLPRYILCVLALVLCCSYVSLVSADSHESTGKFNNLMHGRNSSLSAQPLRALPDEWRIQHSQDADEALDKLNDAKRQAEKNKQQGPFLEELASSNLRAAYEAKSTIDGLNIPEKDELILLAQEAIRKASQASASARHVRVFADDDLEQIEKYIQRANKVKERLNNARLEDDKEIRTEAWHVLNAAKSLQTKVGDKRDNAVSEYDDASEAVAQVQKALKKVTDKQKQEKETVTDTLLTQGATSQPSQEENTPVTPQTNVNEQASASEVTGEKEKPAVTKEGGGSSSATGNVPNSSPVDTDYQSSLPNNAAEEETKSETAPESDKGEIPEGAQEKEEGLKTPEVKAAKAVNESPIKTNKRNMSNVKPVVTTEKNKTHNEVFQKDAHEPTVNTETKETKSQQPNSSVQGSTVNTEKNQSGNTGKKDGTADLNNFSTFSVRNDMDGTNTIGWMPSLPIMFILLAVFPCVILG